MFKFIEKQVKKASGYVEVALFRGERGGYCCGTCKYINPTGGTKGTCTLHLYHLRTWGCCNQWKLGKSSALLGYDGRRLRVIR